MRKSLYAAAMIAALLTGHQSRALAQAKVEASPLNYAGRAVICLDQWDKKKLSTDPKEKELVKYGRSYFVSECNRQLCRQTPNARCRASN